eukprot:TRINITY_DN21907_c0_g3_i1.p1 TRINITY_DN21907_c0_g3~~TRINITY_DN21907_c0_g3_i1.p1  ORF type:complete len:515 (-),score=76.45 TRINITY_DN21907_c0_g3_i1:2424-3968(-)
MPQSLPPQPSRSRSVGRGGVDNAALFHQHVERGRQQQRAAFQAQAEQNFVNARAAEESRRPRPQVTHVITSGGSQANLQVMTGLTSAITQLQQSITTFQAGNSPPTVVKGNKVDTSKLLSSLPKSLQHSLLKRQRELEDHIKKYMRATYSLSKLTEAKKHHALVQSCLDKQWQVSREEMAHAAISAEHWNPKTMWEEMQKRHGEDYKTFLVMTFTEQAKLFGNLVKLEKFKADIKKIVDDYLLAVPIAFHNHSDKQLVKAAADSWCEHAHAKLLAHHEHHYVRTAEKRKKYTEKLATATAELDSMPTDKLLFSAIAEIQDLKKAKADDDNKRDTLASVAGKKPKHKVASTSVLGVLSQKHPDLKTAYQIQVDDDKAAMKSSKNKQKRGRPTFKSHPKSRSPSRGRPSHSSSRSQSSRRTSRSTSRASSSRASSRGRSTSSFRSARSSSRSQSRSRNRQGTSSSTRPRAHSRQSRSTSRGSSKSASFRSSSRGSRGSHKKNKPVFRKTPAPRRRK